MARAAGISGFQGRKGGEQTEKKRKKEAANLVVIRGYHKIKTQHDPVTGPNIQGEGEQKGRNREKRKREAKKQK